MTTQETEHEMSFQEKYPEIKVKLVGEDGNAYAILARCRKAMRKANIDAEVQENFLKEATSGNYNHLLITVMKWFATDKDEEEDYDDD